MSSGVVPKRKTSLWPDALSNSAPSSFSGAVMPPPARTWSSTACALAIGHRRRSRPSINTVAMRKDVFMNSLFDYGRMRPVLFPGRQNLQHPPLLLGRDAADGGNDVLVRAAGIEILDDALGFLAVGDELRVVQRLLHGLLQIGKPRRRNSRRRH